MPYQLPILPYDLGDLAPAISQETMLFHYGRHHKAYIERTNKLLEASPLKGESLEEVVRKSSGELFNNSAQAWNHAFYWRCLTPAAKEGNLSFGLKKAIDESFGSKDALIKKLAASGQENFGSGWTWLVKNSDGKLSVLNTSNAGTPLTTAQTPILTLDVWEHAYYIDYRNERKEYLEAIPRILDWKFASDRFESGREFEATKWMVA